MPDISRHLRAFDREVRSATVAAINRSVQQLREEADREVLSIYNLPVDAVRKASTVRLASVSSSGVSRATVTYSGRRILLTQFDPQRGIVATKRGPRQQVSVMIIRGSRKIVSGAFIGRRNGAGRDLIFKRSGRARYPIKALSTISIPGALASRRLFPALLRFANERVEANLSRR